MYLGLGIENEVLDSAEFYDLAADKWTQTSALKVGRTEHVMGLVYGIPTVIGGKHMGTINIFKWHICVLTNYPQDSIKTVNVSGPSINTFYHVNG